MRIEIPDTPPTLNTMMRMHWSKLRALQQQWYFKVRFAGRYPDSYSNALWEGGGTTPGKYRVIITRYAPRLLDYDRFVGSCTMVIDALKSRHYKKVGNRMMMLPNSGLIYDDSPKYLITEYKQYKSKNKKLVIEIEGPIADET